MISIFNQNKNSYNNDKKLESKEVQSANIYIITNETNADLIYYCKSNNIKGAFFINIENLNDFEKIQNPDMIFILASKDVNEEIQSRIEIACSESTIKVYISHRELHNLSIICTSFIKVSSLNIIEIYQYLKSIIETITVPCLVGFDYSDMVGFFNYSKEITMKTYSDKKENLKNSLQEISDFENVKAIFFVVKGGNNLCLEEVTNISQYLDTESLEYSTYGARIDEKLNGMIEVDLFIGK